MLQEDYQFDDGRGHLPDRIGLFAPRGMRSRIRRAAEEERVSSAAFIRRAVEERLAANVVDAAPAAGQQESTANTPPEKVAITQRNAARSGPTLNGGLVNV